MQITRIILAIRVVVLKYSVPIFHHDYVTFYTLLVLNNCGNGRQMPHSLFVCDDSPNILFLRFHSTLQKTVLKFSLIGTTFTFFFFHIDAYNKGINKRGQNKIKIIISFNVCLDHLIFSVFWLLWVLRCYLLVHSKQKYRTKITIQ